MRKFSKVMIVTMAIALTLAFMPAGAFADTTSAAAGSPATAPCGTFCFQRVAKCRIQSGQAGSQSDACIDGYLAGQSGQ